MNRRELNSAKKNSFFTDQRFATRKRSNICFLVVGPESPCGAVAEGWMRGLQLCLGSGRMLSWSIWKVHTWTQEKEVSQVLPSSQGQRKTLVFCLPAVGMLTLYWGKINRKAVLAVTCKIKGKGSNLASWSHQKNQMEPATSSRTHPFYISDQQAYPMKSCLMHS